MNKAWSVQKIKTLRGWKICLQWFFHFTVWLSKFHNNWPWLVKTSPDYHEINSFHHWRRLTVAPISMSERYRPLLTFDFHFFVTFRVSAGISKSNCWKDKRSYWCILNGFATSKKEILWAHAPSRGGFSMSNSR